MPESLGQKLVAALAHGLVVGPGDDRNLLHVEVFGEFADAGRHVLLGAHQRLAAQLFHPFCLGGAQRLRGGNVRRFKRQKHAAVARQAPNGPRREVVLRLFLTVGSQRPDADAGVRLRVPLAGLVSPLINPQRLPGALAVGEEPGEAVWQAEMRRHLRAIGRTAENPRLRHRVTHGMRLDGGKRVAVRQRRTAHPGQQIAHVGRELRRALVRQRVQGKGRQAVRAGGAPQSQINTPGRQGVKHAELLGDFERRVVRQHDPGAADADA